MAPNHSRLAGDRGQLKDLNALQNYSKGLQELQRVLHRN